MGPQRSANTLPSGKLISGVGYDVAGAEDSISGIVIVVLRWITS